MKIGKIYFSSEEIKNKITNINSNNDVIFYLLESILLKCKSFIESANVKKQSSKNDRKKVFALVVAVRILEISEASFLLMKNGMSNEVNTLFRVFLDAFFIFGNICSNESFIPNYLKSDEAARLKLLNCYSKI